MKKKLFIILGVLVLSTSLLLSFALKKGDNKTNKGISKVEKILEKPAGIQAYTINGRKTDLSYSDLINSYEINGIACKNGTIATYNSSNNTITLSNIHMPDYCTMDFKEIITIYNKLFANNPTIKIRDDFSTTFTEDTTGTLFQTTESIDGENEEYVYYFAGDAKNNWVKFGKYQTDNVVYRGYYSAKYSDSYKEYSTMDACTSASSYNKNCTEHVYWKAGDPMYWRIIRTSHDGNIRMLYSGTSPDTTSGYIGTSVFNNSYNDPMYAGYMYGASGTLASNRTNENDSTIKEVIDAWYSNNLSGYTKYLSQDAVYCNDRKAPNYSASSLFEFYAYTRLNTGNPSYDCEDAKDAFSGNNSEAKLTYPIGLMTADEIVYAGGWPQTDLFSPYAWYYLNSSGGSITGSESWWLLSPEAWNTIYPFMWVVGGSGLPGHLFSNKVYNSGGVRPVISFNGDVQWSSGDGSPENPYEVEELITEDFSWKTSTLGYKILENNPTIKTRTDFSTTFTTTNTGTLYKGSEMNVHNTSDTTVYYFAGDAKNNWVKFAGFYWRIIRTNHDGSIRMLYSGTSPDTEEGYIGESAFNSAEDSPKYAGYMYGTDGSLSESRTNTNDSTIKTYIDNWYSTNLSSYRKYISTEAVYCNNRQLDSGWSWSTSSITFYYITNTRLDWYGSGANANPTYDCADSHDAFSASNADAKLTYPIGLMTADEINIAGGLADNEAPAYYYLNSAGGSITGTTYWWLLSPYFWSGYTSGVWYVDGSDAPGFFDYDNVGSTGAVRPVISINADALYSSGDGSPENPYEIVYN